MGARAQLVGLLMTVFGCVLQMWQKKLLGINQVCVTQEYLTKHTKIGIKI